LEDRAKLKEIEQIMSTDLLELLVLLCSIIMQQYTLQCTTHRNSSATLLPASRPTSHLRCGHRSFGREREGSRPMKIMQSFFLVPWCSRLLDC